MLESHKLNEKFNPKDFEDKLYQEWEENGYFKPSKDKTKETFCVMMPPPNVTGKLHMGHALDDSLQDILVRYKRMRGYRTLWVPGTDHASISTEMKVVQKLKAEGKTKKDLGRDKFIEEAWDWTHLYGGTIMEQQRKLGCSCDWDRKRFTLDDGMSDAVLEQFVNLYNKGLIYKGKRMVNWCTSCNTSISDAEVEYQEEASHLWHIRYKIKDEDRYVIVATTRPETMLGDTAVAVHPDDERYKDIVGKTCILPIMDKEIPIIADEFVEKDFGTGCVKITPAHDMNDYQAGLRHNLDIIEVFDENFKMGNLKPEYAGMELKEAREKIVEKLKEIGALVKEEDYTHNVGKCERCKNTIEPKISEQWFVKMKPLAEPAIEAVKNDSIKFVPKRYEKTYFNWMENIQDWCISRQLWWGHRIPAYYCDKCGHINVSKTKVEKCEKCGSIELHQDEDTLDTWFSSALWPFSTLGWPNKDAEDLKDFYPTNVLVTGYDIIFFWVARMIFSGLETMKEKPFSDILIHGIVRDSQGRKMSKTLGNGIDPLDVIDKYGTDSLRFSLVSGTTPGNDIRYMPEKLEQASNFANKIWNAAKFITMNLADDEKVKAFTYEIFDENQKYNDELLRIEDKWILNKFDKLVVEVSKNIDNYDLGIALDKIYSFIWNEFCDWYIEMVKPRIYSEDENVKVAVSSILNYIFSSSLKLLHPFMPYVTEEIYQMLPVKDNESIMISSYPKYQSKFIFEDVEKIVDDQVEFIKKFRNVKAENNITKDMKVMFSTDDDNELIVKMLKLDNNLVKEPLGMKAYKVFSERIQAQIFFEKIETEADKAQKEATIKTLEASIARREKLLSNENYVNKAPSNIVEMDRKKLEEEKKKLKELQS